MKKVLTIAGSDSSGGAGIQADIKTITAHGVYAMSAITALTAQNTMGVAAIDEVSAEFLAQQIKAVFEDIFPDAVKIGMISSAEQVDVIADLLKEYHAENIVLDPVMVATSGARLSSGMTVERMKQKLMPICTLLTPNIPEAQVLCGMKINTKEDMKQAARQISSLYGCAVLVKGGHRVDDVSDYLYANGSGRWFEGERIENPNTHGTGCTLSSAIASNLAQGYSLHEAVYRAKSYISSALRAMMDIGKGSGPLNHMFGIQKLNL